MDEHIPKPQGLTIRAILIGLACVVLLCAYVPYNDYYVQGTFLAGNHFPIGAVFLLAIFVLVINVLLKLVWKGVELKPGELATIWCMMTVTIGIPTVALARWLFPIMIGFRYFATPENEWREIFYPRIPNWLSPSDSKVAKYFYEGVPSGISIPWSAWIKPLAYWLLVACCIWAMMVFLSAIFRKQWVEREKYAFPLTQLPAEMIRSDNSGRLLNSFLRNGLFWVGIAIPSVIHIVNGLHHYFPSVPQIPARINLSSALYERPWSAARPMWLYFFPSVVGFTYLINLDIALSLWLFYLLYKLQLVIGTALGFSIPISVDYEGAVFVAHQEMGAFIVAVVFFLWIGREHFKKVSRSLFSEHDAGDQYEPIPYRWAVIGLVLSVVLGASVLKAAGVSFLLGVSVITLMGISAIILTWLVIAGGVLHVNGSFRAIDFFFTILGSSRLKSSLTVIMIPSSVFRTKRGFFMPHIANAFKLSDSVNLNRRRLLAVMLVALLLSLPLTCYFFLRMCYTLGASNLQYWTFSTSPLVPFRWLTTVLRNPTDTNWLNVSFIGIGSVVMFLMIFMRYRFFWWPIHPIGYVSSPGEWPMNNLWFSILLGWLAKGLVMKYGGLKAYRKARPVLLGLVLGDCIIGGIWSIVAVIVGKGYTMLPG
ncbi:DUF6785 family protein [Candidatus Poribacteria bacterium]